ncbi:MAG: molybdopterin-binding protein [Chloroflexi bacterium]|nr:molybdopterin-binding protein [Chloroflexota bacterium]
MYSYGYWQATLYSLTGAAAKGLTMKFGPIPTEQAEGKILGHNIAAADGRRLFRKGRALTTADISALLQSGRTVVYVADLQANDVSENEAAQRVTTAVIGPNLTYTGPAAGRTNLRANVLGVLRIDANRLARLNSQLGITLATLTTNTAVSPRKIVATVKVIPYAVSETAVTAIKDIAAESGPLIRIDALPPRRVHLILSGSPPAQERIVGSFEPPLRNRLQALGSTLDQVDFIPLEDESGERDLAAKIQERLQAKVGLIILAGETAIMDRHDIAPRAVERAGGVVTCFGAPVDPGNLLMLAYIGRVPILGAPGCARSPKPNIVDKVLPRLLVGDRLTQTDIVALGHGGLLEDVAERPYPRH